MKKNFIKTLYLVCFIVVTIICLSFAVSAETVSGEYSIPPKNSSVMRWSYDTETKIITLGGEKIECGEKGPGFYDDEGRFVPISWNGSKVPWSVYANEINTIIVEEGTKILGRGVFSIMPNLEFISLPESLTHIEEEVFYNCPKLVEITTDINRKMEAGILYVPDTLIYFGDCISGNPNFDVDSLPKKLEYIDESFTGTKFYNDKDNWENGGLYINDFLVAFDKSTGGSYTVKEGTRLVGGYAFFNNDRIEEIVFPKSVELVCELACNGCDNLKKITIYNYKMSTGELRYGAVANSWSSNTFPKNTIFKCYKYSTAHSFSVKYQTFEAEHMGWSPDATFIEKIRYFFWDILTAFGFKVNF